MKNSSIEVQAVCEKGSFTIKDYGLYYAPAENEREDPAGARPPPAGFQDLLRGQPCGADPRLYETLAGHEDTCVSIQEDKVISLIEAIPPLFSGGQNHFVEGDGRTMSEARKGAPKIALNMSMVKTIMWDKGPDYTFERVKAAGLSYFELSQVDMTDAFIDQVLEASASTA